MRRDAREGFRVISRLPLGSAAAILLVAGVACSPAQVNGQDAGPDSGSASDAGADAGADAGTDGGSPGRVDGTCGAASGIPSAVAPTSGFCSVGTPTAVTGTGPWSWTCVGSGGGSTAQCAAPLLPPGFFVATNGKDSYPGTFAQPFATVAAAQHAMQASATVKTTYIRAGSYAPAAIPNCDGTATCGIAFGAADRGETLSYYPPDGVDSADFTGGSTAFGNGLFEIINAANSQNATLNGLSLHDFQYGAIVAVGGAVNLTVENCLMFNGHGNGYPGNPAGFQCYGCANTVISHNVVHDIEDFGISFGQVNGDISNLLIMGNVVYRTCTASSDCGAIYIQDTTAQATNMRVIGNYVHDGNINAALGSGGGSGLYSDDCTSNLTATGNVLTGRNGSNTIHIHGGNNDHIFGNITDLAGYGQHILVLQTSAASGCAAAAMTGNEYRNNIVVGLGGGGGYGLLSGTPMNAPAIANNDYFSYDGGAPIGTGGAYSDSSPVSEDPQLSGWKYQLAPSSPVFQAPVSFPGIDAGWGPPGYALPDSGTPPSPPH
jgi:hypothetical protein